MSSRAVWSFNKRITEHDDKAGVQQLRNCKGQGSFRGHPCRENWRKQKYQKRRRRSWFKITIPHGKKYDKKWLLNALQDECSLSFTPVKYHTQGYSVHFFIDDAAIASALSKASRKITGPKGYKLTVRMKPCSAPSFIHTELTPEELERLKQCMSKRFDGSEQALDLKSIGTDPDLMCQNIEMLLNRKSCMQAVIKIIEEHIPTLTSINLSTNQLCHLDGVEELLSKVPSLKALNLSRNGLKTEQELDKLQGFKLVELWLDGNPLCAHFKDQATYISAIRQRFPQLLRLDGCDLPQLEGFDVEGSTTLPFHCGEIKKLVMRFLQDYYGVYDSDNRQPLLDAYHERSSFSFRAHFPGQNPSTCGLGDYHRDSCNLHKLKEPTAQFHLLKRTRLSVVALLNELPKTLHDTASFNIHVNSYSNTSLSFTVSGVFREVDSRSADCFKAFSRLFVAVPARNGGLCIVNDELCVKNATEEKIRGAFRTMAPPHSSGPVCTVSAFQQEMLSAFSLQSGMNLEWSKKCLEDNKWDFNRAAHIFTNLKAMGKIPHIAFKN
ncbi:nuclear RNA export factor 1-like [Megalops cyprinoides]|uniref:nuclear RNA export factor 1-like n=1 Tax=Megalops cyprinoides TaxID=118141 RepID=UPI001864C46F|nr:nuclear RNA export factor 1-like [Megalops cyprinoides]